MPRGTRTTATKYISRRPLNLAQQAASIRRILPAFEVVLHRGLLIARGTITPSRISKHYRIAIEYSEGDYPRVRVEDPALSRRAQMPADPIPHTYDADKPGKETPCSFHPAMNWDGTRSIALTVIPWIMSWLVDYEIWQATGEWHGGGLHPTVTGQTRKKVRRLLAGR